MDLCGRSQRGALREASRKQASPRRWSRVNGWSWPLHTFQAVAWTTLFILAFANFGIFVPLLPPNWNLVIYGVTGGLFCFHFVVHLLAISIDPAETNVRLKNYSEPVPTFDPSKHTHVIENQYCHLCEITVNRKAKHCRACNKCVSDFDHHCKWLNNCVGGRNYRQRKQQEVTAFRRRVGQNSWQSVISSREDMPSQGKCPDWALRHHRRGSQGRQRRFWPRTCSRSGFGPHPAGRAASGRVPAAADGRGPSAEGEPAGWNSCTAHYRLPGDQSQVWGQASAPCSSGTHRTRALQGLRQGATMQAALHIHVTL
ncbi:palmitoyltransferase ZDHHC11-like isoform X5 [Prionailurus viverrinus]|uniref:palmitoyltransferase ZDHHC11-like isoform X5 n=1 Tax=Prionailurus viverrinus TaxID=61388 RepID=UPI001FF33C84|nr:palmitoyltransferase ZDHHC11-like isoform X5 [Prionailurus viverrinus]